MIIKPNLFEFAYIPIWYDQLDRLAEMAIPEPWHFRDPAYETKNIHTPILERYIQILFQQAALDHYYATDETQADQAFYIRNEVACFNTGLLTPRYASIFAYFERNKRKDTTLDWYFRGFAEQSSPWLKYIEPLPRKVFGINRGAASCYYPDWNIRINYKHILEDQENAHRLPPVIRELENAMLLMDSAVELARRKANYSPSIVVPQMYGEQVQFLLPLCLSNMDKPDIVMVLSPVDGYYSGTTCITLEMAYLNARLIEKPTAPWLLNLIER